MSRKLTTVPISRSQRIPEVPDKQSLEKKDQILKYRHKSDYNQRCGVRERLPLNEGDTVWIPSRPTEAVVGVEVAPRSYEVITLSGITRKNRNGIVTAPLTTSHGATNQEPTETDGMESSTSKTAIPESSAPERFQTEHISLP